MMGEGLRKDYPLQASGALRSGIIRRVLAALCFALVLIPAVCGHARSAPGAATTAPAVSGKLIGGFRVLDVPESSKDLRLTVYRGDYVKFNPVGGPASQLLTIPDLAVEQTISGRLDEAPYFKMDKAGVYPFALGTSAGAIAVIDFQQAQYREVTSKEAAELIQAVQPFILDVRTPSEYGRGHLKNSVLIPVQQLQSRWQEIAAYKDKDVLVYCATGNRSTVAAKILIDNGFKRVLNMRQGIAGWQRENQPLAP
jgi:rhodanese-related sulfurtransferase